MQPSLARLSVAFAVLAAPSIGSAQTSIANEGPPEGLTAADWSSIRDAYEAGRHAAFAVDGGYEARSVGQAWRTRFDGRGFTVRPDAGGWTWGLELERYGFAGHERAVASAASTSAQGRRVAHGWDDTLEEWYVNDTHGLEHGYTVRRPPPGNSRGEVGERGPLTFTLAVRGDLAPEVADDGGGVSFVDEDGAPVLTYSGLAAFDADGRELGARLERRSGALFLAVDERGARYPITIDPTAQQAYLKASNTEASDGFGFSAAISGDIVVVGATGEDSGATGVNGNGSNNGAFGAGAAYVFVRSGSTWSQEAYLKASNTEAGDVFGFSVSVSGETVVVGALYEDSSAVTVNGNQGDNESEHAGAAYVFVRSGTTWSQQAYLKAFNSAPGDELGSSVSVSDDTIVVGARNQGSDEGGRFGAAYVFSREGTAWTQEPWLTASNRDVGDKFGSSVSVSGDTAVIGAPGEASNATGVNGNEGNNGAFGAGAAYVFLRSGSTWDQEAYLKASNTDAYDAFGLSVSVSGETVVVGAPGEASNASGVNGDESNNGASNTGAAYVFSRDASVWGQEAYLKASNPDSGDRFGGSVSISDDTVAVGSYHEDSRATGVNGSQNNSGQALNSGAAYVFGRNGTTWSQVAYLKASNTDPADEFATAVAVSGDTVIAGAAEERSNATGVNGNQSNNSFVRAGAAYTFLLAAPIAQSLTPPQGPFEGGNAVTILGEGFTRATTVDFSGVPSPRVTFVSPGELSVEVPRWPLPPRSIRGPLPHAAVFTTVDVSVALGPRRTTLAGAYTYELELRRR